MDVVFKILTELILSIFTALFYLRELSQCAAPMHIWVVAWWITVVVGMTCMCIDKVRYFVGDIGGIIYIVLFFALNILGCFMYVFSLIKTPNCVPDSIAVQIFFFMLIVFLLFIGAIGYVLCQGFALFRRLFFDERKNTEIIDQIRSGEINVEDYIRNHPSLDEYAMFASEIDLLRELCRGPPAGFSERGETDCCVCMDALDSQPTQLYFPGCGHQYHESCLLTWLEKKTNCPMCRRGVRSSLYRLLSFKSTQQPLTQAEAFTEA